MSGLETEVLIEMAEVVRQLAMALGSGVNVCRLETRIRQLREATPMQPSPSSHASLERTGEHE